MNQEVTGNVFYLDKGTSKLHDIFFFVLLVVAINARSQSPQLNSRYVSKVWVADQGNGTYKNPIIYADYSDPDVIRVGNDYYLTASSFQSMPGLPLLHSKDLVNWTIINNALTRQVPEDFFNVPQHGLGVWAPCLRFHKGEFYIYWGDPDHGIYMIKTRDPKSVWEKPVLVLEGKGRIDPSPLWDDNGNAYIVHAWAGSRAGVNSLLTVYRMSSDGTKILDEGKNIYSGHGNNHTVEGPKLYRRNGFYYIFAPAGGVTSGWQLVLRSKNIYGPYEERVVLDQGTTQVNGPHQGGWVETQTGEAWFVHFQDAGVYGRVLHLQPVTWKNDWPVIGVDKDGDGKGEPVSVYKKPGVGKTYFVTTPAESDEFNLNSPGLQWQWQANPKVTWSAVLPGNGFLRLFAIPQPKDANNLWTVPNILMQKFPAPDFTATAKIKFNIEWDVWQTKKAGLIIMGNDYSYLSISKNEKGFTVSQVVCNNAGNGGEERVIEERQIDGPSVYLSVTVNAPSATCLFSFSEDGKMFSQIGQAFTAAPDKWMGAKVGLFCTGKSQVRIGGYADVDWFRIEK